MSEERVTVELSRHEANELYSRVQWIRATAALGESVRTFQDIEAKLRAALDQDGAER